MNKKFLRDDFEYYLEIEEEGGEEYEYQMLVANHIGTLLPVNIMTVNEKRQLIYSASGYKTLESCLEKMVINGKQILQVMECVLGGIDEVRRYLLMDCLFVEADFSRVGLIYVPGYSRDIILQLRELIDNLLGRIDPSDIQSVMLAWKLHALTKDEHISLKEIRKIMSGYKENETVVTSEEDLSKEHPEYKEVKQAVTRTDKGVKSDWKERISIPQMISLATAVLFAILVIVMLVLIYVGGILPWKRNVLLIVGVLLVINIGVCVTIWKKDQIIYMLRTLQEK